MRASEPRVQIADCSDRDEVGRTGEEAGEGQSEHHSTADRQSRRQTGSSSPEQPCRLRQAPNLPWRLLVGRSLKLVVTSSHPENMRRGFLTVVVALLSVVYVALGQQ